MSTSGARAFQASVLLLALVFLAFHLRYLPASLEDLDSINFALGIRDFDVARHQPHPPGYPLFIVAAKLVHRAVPSEAGALALLGVAGGVLGVVAIAWLFQRLARDRDDGWTFAATAVAVTSPLYWFTASRPLSDVAGLGPAIAVQALTLGARDPRGVLLAAVAAGVATGIRSQVAWLTGPLLLYCGVRNAERGTGARLKAGLGVIVAFAIGVLAWLVPLVMVSGGPVAYWHALFNQGAEDLTGIRMLWTTPTVRALIDALYFALVAPWAEWPIAAIVLVFAAIGVLIAWRSNRRALVLVAVAFGPYFLFDLVFQETFTTRYALPLVVPMAWCAVEAVRRLPARLGLAVVIPLVMFDAHVGGRSLGAYARRPAPAFRLLADLRQSPDRDPVVAMDRREALDLRRPLEWAGGLPPGATRLATPPRHESLELINHWSSNEHSRGRPTWFMADPLRTDIDLVQHGEPVRYRWELPYPVLLGGVRPNEIDFYRLDRPEWYVGEGWALTPEAAGVAGLDRKGLETGPLRGWVRQGSGPATLLIGGRNFEGDRRSLAVALGGQTIRQIDVPPGPFLAFVDAPALASPPAGAYVPIEVASTPPGRVGLEQFEFSRDRPIVGFDAGWHEPEYNPATGRQWRWLSERGELRIVARRPSTVRLEGESPLTYFSRPSRLVVRNGERVVLDRLLGSDFSVEIPVPEGASTLTLTTDQAYVPAERSRRSPDRRHLGLRVFRCVATAASGPGPATSSLPAR